MLQVLTDLHPADQASCPAIEEALQHRVGQQIFADDTRDKLVTRHWSEKESLGTYNADLHLYIWCGYPTFDDAMEEDIHLEDVARAFRKHIRSSAPMSLGAVLAEAERVEHVLQ